MSGVTRGHKIRNNYIKSNIGVALIVDKMRVNRFRWLDHVLRRKVSQAARLVKGIYVEG